MTSFSSYLQEGAAHAWLYVPSAILLGALHGLEPGHSKTMMAAFIMAVRGTVWQAILLGLATAFSHSLVIWLLAAVALKFGSQWNPETSEPYFQLASAVLIASLAAWMLWRTRRELQAAAAHQGARSHGEESGHSHDEIRQIDTGHGVVHLSIFETEVPPVFRLSFSENGGAYLPDPTSVLIETVRPDGTRQKFTFASREGFMESVESIPEPHEFRLTLSLAHSGHTHTYPIEFSESHPHGPTSADGDYQDAHQRAHASDIERRFAHRQVTTGQIVVFGLTGGLLPCPAAFTILLVCLQVKQVTLGFALVAAFSLGLAATLVAVGSVAAWSVNHAQKRFAGFGDLMRKAPYFSSTLLLVLAGYMAWQGWRGLALHPH